MILQFALFLFGLALLLAGAHMLVDGSSKLAGSLGVSRLFIGLTVVAFGTSAPELAVNIQAALSGKTDIGFGNIVGSNIGNIGLIIGVCALLRPLTIEGILVRREIPMMILVTLAGLVLGFDTLLRTGPGIYDRFDGLMLLLLFGIFMFYTVAGVLRKETIDPLLEQTTQKAASGIQRKLSANLALSGLGLIMLILGAHLSTGSAVHLSKSLGVPPAVVGLSLVALGTSLPELVTSVVATWKGHTDLAVGNIVGSNIFNLGFIQGLTALIKPVAVPKGGLADLWVMMGFAALLLPFAITDRLRIVRWEGGVLLTAYAGYMTIRFLSMPSP
ncbi:MAG: calcium/sodium antiporter [Candidatus Eisenbacteria bacterium]|uniref:Calcium/sodium antiporter n=1 Tax=Eiseniibacteriota bacterium TaxID=2212470 RepID=A0A948RX64_UNCEI|nr:calcium/sodium antiporter [Candidatus Eisenbacteria bacterium]MBU1950510.1 calcium/sodium antiporter [Candidatus Eisenbacteria bacterium]MBU2691183.1 calcium/sodium antiporter [Candidatus Eisenbacteria bacterium]